MANGNSLLVGGKKDTKSLMVGGGEGGTGLQVGGGTAGSNFNIDNLPDDVRNSLLTATAKIPSMQDKVAAGNTASVKSDLNIYMEAAQDSGPLGIEVATHNLQIKSERNDIYAQLLENGVNSSKAFLIANTTLTETEKKDIKDHTLNELGDAYLGLTPATSSQGLRIVKERGEETLKQFLKFAARTGVASLDHISKTVVFASDYIARRFSETPGIGVGPVDFISLDRGGKLKEKWLNFYDEQVAKGRIPLNQIRGFVDQLRKLEFVAPSKEWQAASEKDRLTKHLPETILLLGPEVVASIGSFAINPAFGITTMALSAAEDVKQTALKYDVPKDKAEMIGLTTGILVGMLERVFPSRLFKQKALTEKFIRGFARRIGEAAIIEPSTELTQEGLTIIAEATFRDDIKLEEVGSRSILSIIGGLIGGVGGQTVVTFSNSVQREGIMREAQKIAPIGLSIEDVSEGKDEDGAEDTALPEGVNPEDGLTLPKDKTGIEKTKKDFADYIDSLPSIDKTVEGQDHAELMTIVGRKKTAAGEFLQRYFGVAGMFGDDLRTQYEDWVDTIASGNIENIITQREFRDLDALGLEAIFRIQAGEEVKGAEKVREFFDENFKILSEAGFEINYKQNYITQLWADSPARVNAVFQRRLGLSPSFTLESIIKSYKEGIENGLTPRFTKASQIAGWYKQRVVKALADRKFYIYLADNNFIQPSGDAPIGWEILDPKTFPKFKTRLSSGGTYSGTYSAPPMLARAINNYLGSGSEILAAIARFFSVVKNITLSAGIPFTGQNAHGINIIARNMAARGPMSGLLSGKLYALRPDLAAQYVERNLKMASFAVRHGLTLRIEEHGFDDIMTAATDGELKKLGKGILKIQRTLFEDPLFKKMIPALKIQYFDMMFRDLRAHYSMRDAARLAARITNNMFGGINYDAIGRDKDLQNILRIIILAPDWAETQIRLAGRVAQSLYSNGKMTRQYRRVIFSILIAYIGATILNKLLSGKWMHENEVGHKFQIALGVDSTGQIRYWTPFGTAIDFVRIPYEVSASIIEGDLSAIPRILRNRLSPLFGTIVSLTYNTDYAGRPIFGKDKYGNPQSVMQQATNFISSLSGIPPQVGGVIDILSGRSTVEEGIIRAIELPFRYAVPRGDDKNKYRAGSTTRTKSKSKNKYRVGG